MYILIHKSVQVKGKAVTVAARRRIREEEVQFQSFFISAADGSESSVWQTATLPNGKTLPYRLKAGWVPGPLFKHSTREKTNRSCQGSKDLIKEKARLRHLRPRINKNDTITILNLTANKILGKSTVRQVYWCNEHLMTIANLGLYYDIEKIRIGNWSACDRLQS